ncbi:MAG TPA: argininosuccinate lyase [Candidatus Limnocylindria bacterium]|nr:argininosuccinate lyase [Candidatus Limnocylindria bacterium]
MKTWGARLGSEPDALALDFGQSLDVDVELAVDDVTGSIAYARALGHAGVLAQPEVEHIVAGLTAIREDVVVGSMPWDPSLEDVHMNVEFELARRIGPLAGKLHSGRSRNDQVSTDLRLWLRRSIDAIDTGVQDLERALVGLARRHADVVMPAHTHTQPAQPVLFAHHLLAHVQMLERDRGRLADARRRVNVSPLGAGAIAGSGVRLDRERLAEELGFEGVTRNSIDASGDRDFVVETLAAVALAMVHLSRLAEELVWWSSPAFGFVRLSDAVVTGSSMLPNKRNPDPAELVRGRAARVIGNLSGVLAMLKGLPLGYQRDLQEDKPPLFESVRILRESLAVLGRVVAGLEVDAERMREAVDRGFLTAVSAADALADLGVAFRDAHHILGRLVRRAEERGVALGALDDADIHEALGESEDAVSRTLAQGPDIAEHLRAALSVDAALARPDVIGGTAPGRVAAELALAAARLGLA